MPQPEKVVLDADDVRRTLVRIAHEIVERNGDGPLALVGIHTRGAHLARRLHAQVAAVVGGEGGDAVGTGELDIAFYRDDLDARAPEVRSTRLDFVPEDRTVVLVDDVLYTGRTVRSGIEALFAYGRPARVQLAVLVDRGHRELPLRPDYVGKNLPTSSDERVNVRLVESDGSDEVTITEGDAAGADRGAAGSGAAT